MTRSPDQRPLAQLRRDAKSLKRAFEAGEAEAHRRITSYAPRAEGTLLKHADYLHVIARENSFSSWPALKLAVDLLGMDRAARLQRLKLAVRHGHHSVVDRLLADTPDLADGYLGLEIGLYRRAAVEAAINADPAKATEKIGPAPPLVYLAASRMIHHWPERAQDMLAIADLLLEHGADLDLGMPAEEGSSHMLSPLYFAIGHADNRELGHWLLERGANPNDNESLYHATELGHHEGLKLLLAHGADPKGTNALLRAMDFDDVDAVRMLLRAGARADDFNNTPIDGEPPFVVPALHQAARRMCSREMIDLLLDAGADPNRRFEGVSTYGYAHVFGNQALAEAFEARGLASPLTPEETVLAKAAHGDDIRGLTLDTSHLPETYQGIIRMILHLPGKLDHVKRLVALGIAHDRPDAEGLTPVQVAGWEGLPEMMAYLLSLNPDLAHINGYGGTLFSTIIHGSENCPARAERDYVTCLELALQAGVRLPRRAIDLAGDEEVAAFLADWAALHPECLTAGGVV